VLRPILFTLVARRKMKGSGFTLVELLVVIAILAILAAFLTPVVTTARQRAEGTQRLAGLRDIGSMIHLHTVDSQGRLPGPLWPGQVPVYDPQRAGRLAGELAPYLGLDPADGVTTVPLLLPQALDRNRPPGVADVDFRTFVMNLFVRDGDEDWLQPWGDARVELPPLNIATLATRAPAIWGFSEADQSHPRVAGSPWGANTIATPLPKNRLAWFFDGSIAPLKNEDIESPP